MGSPLPKHPAPIGYLGYCGHLPGQMGNQWIGYRVGIGYRLSCGVTGVTAVTDGGGVLGEVAAPGVGQAVFPGGLVTLHGLTVDLERAGFDPEAAEESG